MTATDIKNRILELTNHFEFSYGGVDCFIDPYSRNNIYLGYGGVDKTYTDIGSLMSDPIFDGKSLNEIADKIELV